MIPVIIGGISNKQANFDYTMNELANLALANNLQVCAQIRQNLDTPNAATYFGQGKCEEIKTLAQLHDCEILIVNDELSAIQIRNLENLTQLQILDRTALILEIFASRARSKEAKLQVQIAKLQYQLPRLKTSSINKFDQQTAGNTGGGYTNRGAGETKLELNRRVIEKRITHLKNELKELTKSQATQRQARKRSNLKTVALVGYTNAGKSTTLNGLLKLLKQDETKQVFEKDMLFATLDTSIRRLNFADNKSFLLSDTVGFVSKLPHQLVAAFKSTLQEAKEADLLIHVVDSSDPHAQEMIATTNQTLKEIGISEQTPVLYAFNKADQTTITYPQIQGNDLFYSAKDEASLYFLSKILKEKLFTDLKLLTFLIPYAQGKYLEALNTKAHILTTKYLNDGTLITAEVDDILAGQLAEFIVQNK